MNYTQLRLPKEAGTSPSSEADSAFVQSDSRDEAIVATSIFDNLAKAVSSGVSRRKACAYVLKGLAAMAFAELGIRSAWANDTCLCGGDVYDPATECCTSNGVSQKYPITNLSNCPNKVAHPGHVPMHDGCGSKASFFNANRVPQRFLTADFSSCCNNHDECYDSCNNDKSTDCDNPFLSCLQDSCASAFPLIGISGILSGNLLGNCLEVASVYYAAVSVGGGTAYGAAQSQACDCCSESTCTQGCAGSSCGSLPACNGGDDCVCFTSTEGTGACSHGDTPCDGILTCNTTADCPAGSACLFTSCCGSFGVCGPLCNPIVPAAAPLPSRLSARAKGPTLARRHPKRRRTASEADA